jgi:hypothetical protein
MMFLGIRDTDTHFIREFLLKENTTPTIEVVISKDFICFNISYDGRIKEIVFDKDNVKMGSCGNYEIESFIKNNILTIQAKKRIEDIRFPLKIKIY